MGRSIKSDTGKQAKFMHSKNTPRYSPTGYLHLEHSDNFPFSEESNIPKLSRSTISSHHQISTISISSSLFLSTYLSISENFMPKISFWMILMLLKSHINFSWYSNIFLQLKYFIEISNLKISSQITTSISNCVILDLQGQDFLSLLSQILIPHQYSLLQKVWLFTLSADGTGRLKSSWCRQITMLQSRCGLLDV